MYMKFPKGTTSISHDHQQFTADGRGCAEIPDRYSSFFVSLGFSSSNYQPSEKRKPIPDGPFVRT